MRSSRRLFAGIFALISIIAAGVIGYMIIEGWSFLDALYMTVTTITTVGFNEVHPLSDGGMIFSILLIIGGVGGALYTLTGFIEYIFGGYFGITLGRRRMKNKISKLKDHFILCGYGRVGQEIARVFQEEGVPFVVIDNDQNITAEIEAGKLLYLYGDATNDETLKEAGIDKARGLIAAVGSDIDNTYITLSARELSPDLFIEARASSQETATKLDRAGADRIVSPHRIGARRMAMLAMRPAVVDFIDTITRRRGPELHLENIVINAESSLAGQTVAAVRLYSKANVLALNKQTGKLVANPSEDEQISAGDSLIVMGTSEQLMALEPICEGVKSHE